MLTKLGTLLEIVKTPSATVIAIALLLTLFLTTSVSNTQMATAAELREHRAEIMQIELQQHDHRVETTKAIADLKAALEKYAADEKARGDREARLLQGICYYAAQSTAQRDWCIGVGSGPK